VPEDYRVHYKTLLKDQELSVQEIIAFIDYLVDEHELKKVSVTGGEPLLRIVWPRTQQVLEHLNQRKLNVQLNTGGLGEISIIDIVRIFDDPSKLMFQISLDGSTSETVDRFRHRQGVFHSALQQMAVAVAAGAKVQVRFTISESNIDEAIDAYRIVASVPVDFFKIKPMFAAGTAIEHADKLITSPDRIAQLQKDLITLSSDYTTVVELPPPVFVDPLEFAGYGKFHIIECSCGRDSAYLSSNGDLYPCSYTIGDGQNEDFKLGNIREPGFSFVKTWTCSKVLEKYRRQNGYRICPSQTSLLRNIITRSSN
jgi:radical SAM protein with 4Fe4S-binding SPASM domain